MRKSDGESSDRRPAGRELVSRDVGAADVAWFPRPEEGFRPTLTKNRRYEAHYDALSDKRIAGARPRPTTLPAQAYGPGRIDWVPANQSRPAVWAWVSWPDRPAERIAAFASGWNDRVVIVTWDGPGGAIDTVVWRNAVTRRRT